MDVFDYRQKLIRDYSSYVRSFLAIRDERIDGFVKNALDSGALWPEPLIQLNPSFQPGAHVDELVDEGVLQEGCRGIFRREKSESDPIGKPLRLHRHQEDAIRTSQTGDSYVLTTGTGSGKSLSYIIPIVDHVLRRGSGKGIQAIVVYPMNALANSQQGELQKFLQHGFGPGKEPVTFARYTGQEQTEEREAILKEPPDILLTNYVMLELILTRPREIERLVEKAKGLQFFVLDELHTYRGRQGADVAMLCRRVRNLVESPGLQCVGTSATIAGGGTIAEQRIEVAAVASKIFGTEILPKNVIGETLERITRPEVLGKTPLRKALKERLRRGASSPIEFDEFVADPVAIWIEEAFGITKEKESGTLIRVTPRGLEGQGGAGPELRDLTGLELTQCIEAIEDSLLTGNLTARVPETGFPVFAFRLHQFISRGDTVYASLEAPETRYLTLRSQQYVPDNRDKILLPMAFCRECGQEYYMVRRQPGHVPEFLPRELRDMEEDEHSESGFLFPNDSNPWPEDAEEVVERLPDTFLEEYRGGTLVKKSFRRHLPVLLNVAPSGDQSGDGLRFAYIRAPFRFCLHCGVAYHARRGDFGKLSTLASEGRSTATTVLALSAIRQLREEQSLRPEARKLLSFTDNRQDASLQAGHFNDFVEIGLLRSAIFKAVVEAGPDGIEHAVLPQKVFESLDLPLSAYAAEPDAQFARANQTKKAFREVLGYRIYHDLRRGWRVTAPNLEQCGLLEIEYESLDEFCAAEDVWLECHEAITTATSGTRLRICKTLLDFLRRSLVIRVNYLDPAFQEALKQRSSQHLIEPWGIDENERLEYSATAFPRSTRGGDFQGNIFLSGRSGFGVYLSAAGTFPDFGRNLALADREDIIKQLFERLEIPGGFLSKIREPAGEDDVPGYQLAASSMLWKAGEGTKSFHDPIQTPQAPLEGGRTNPFFVQFYREVASAMGETKAREHTAQVPSAEREKREIAFRQATLPILFCSPTMELGIDIKDLNVVNLRNVPPTPANYAQRSGRAGRSGQPALVFTYCTTGSPHDQYFFRRPQLMVSGQVAPPRIDLANEDLLRAHVQAIWLKETGMSLERSLTEILDVSSNEPSLEILAEKQGDIDNPAARTRALVRARDVLGSIREDLEGSEWHYVEWAEDVLKQVGQSFEVACNRWRTLYLAAMRQAKRQDLIIRDATRSSDERREAERLRTEAEAQLKLLIDSRNVMQSDFYSYRYFASEGFLPGYNFPRLPLSAYIPARRVRGENNEFLSRPRFLAISEFGPRALVYHEGSKYIINKVILPVGEEEGEGLLQTRAIKLCPHCGYLHEETSVDVCEHCSTALSGTLASLFRMENVSTRRREKINSDEEERLRMGYEIRSGVRFADRGGRPCLRSAQIIQKKKPVGNLRYGDAATLWRINYGWARRAEREQLGFVLDVEKGIWQRNADLPAEGEEEEGDPAAAVTKRVIPFVEDRRNALILDLEERVEEAIKTVRKECNVPDSVTPKMLRISLMASLQAALKMAIQVEFQLEDSELAAEPLPNADLRNFLLFFEAAEGGAGALRRLVEEEDAIARVARRALDLCHFHPDTGKDLGQAEGATERCAAACYDCLMSYYNQRDHLHLDRFLIRGLLRDLATSVAEPSPVPVSRKDHLSRLLEQSDSELESAWLRFLEQHDLRLPTDAQVLIEACRTRPDFLYREKDSDVAIYVDGPRHDFPDRQERDAGKTEMLEDHGYLVIRFHHQDDWEEIVSRYPGVFGNLDKPASTASLPEKGGDQSGGIDPDLFEVKWHTLVRAIHGHAGFAVEPGRDLMQSGQVVASAFAVVRAASNEVALIDQDAENLDDFSERAKSSEEPVLSVSADDEPEAVIAKITQLVNE